MTAPDWVQLALARKCIVEHNAVPNGVIFHEFKVQIQSRGVPATKAMAIDELEKQLHHARNLFFSVTPHTDCLNGLVTIQMKGSAW